MSGSAFDVFGRYRRSAKAQRDQNKRHHNHHVQPPHAKIGSHLPQNPEIELKYVKARTVKDCEIRFS